MWGYHATTPEGGQPFHPILVLVNERRGQLMQPLPPAIPNAGVDPASLHRARARRREPPWQGRDHDSAV
jgi:hypothetical protein